MACHSTSLAEEAALAEVFAECGKGAPLCCAGVICSPLSSLLDGISNSLVMIDLAEVCSLSGAVILSFDSTAIQLVTSWPSLSPHSSACTVTGQSCDCPSASTYVKAGRFRFTMFPIESRVGWVLPLHRWLVVYGMRVASAYSCPLTLWRKPPSLFVPVSQSPLACYIHDVYQQFTYINP